MLLEETYRSSQGAILAMLDTIGPLLHPFTRVLKYPCVSTLVKITRLSLAIRPSPPVLLIRCPC